MGFPVKITAKSWDQGFGVDVTILPMQCLQPTHGQRSQRGNQEVKSASELLASMPAASEIGTDSTIGNTTTFCGRAYSFSIGIGRRFSIRVLGYAWVPPDLLEGASRCWEIIRKTKQISHAQACPCLDNLLPPLQGVSTVIYKSSC